MIYSILRGRPTAVPTAPLRTWIALLLFELRHVAQTEGSAPVLLRAHPCSGDDGGAAGGPDVWRGTGRAGGAAKP
jgi:hypothetical protein